MSTCMHKSIWLTSFVISMNLGQKVVETALDSHFDVIFSVLCFRLYTPYKCTLHCTTNTHSNS